MGLSPAVGRILAILLVLLLTASGHGRTPATAPAAVADAAAGTPLRVAVHLAPPFVMEVAGELEGVSIELWDRVATRLGRTAVYEAMSLEAMLDAVAAGEVDAALSAISITAEREQRMDLSHGYHLAGLAVAMRTDALSGRGLGTFIRGLLSPEFLTVLGVTTLLLMLVGVLIWLAERHVNPDHFPRQLARGIGNGFWFSVVTLTTVGYGDRTPRTLHGRIIAMTWMLLSLLVISIVTGTIASSLTTARLDAARQGLEDLPNLRVGVVVGTVAEQAMRDRGISATALPDVEQGLAAVLDRRLDAFVHDHPILVHEVRRLHPRDLSVLPRQFDVTAYAVALPPDSPLRKPVNQAILSITGDPAWSVILRRYVGDAG